MLYLHILLFCWNLQAFITVYGAITRVILRQYYVSSVLTLYGRAACGGQRCRYSRPETENSLIIQHQHLTTFLHSDIYVGFSTDDIQHNAVGKDNRSVSLAFIRFTGSVRIIETVFSVSSLKKWIITRRNQEGLKGDSGVFSVEEPLSIQILSSQEYHVSF